MHEWVYIALFLVLGHTSEELEGVKTVNIEKSKAKITKDQQALPEGS